MATSSFKSTSRRGAATEPKAPPPSAASRRRSHSVTPVSRKNHAPLDHNASISTDFCNSRDNPLFWTRSSSPPDKDESGRICEIAASSNKLSSKLDAKSLVNGNGGGNSSGEQRGRSVTRSHSHSNGIGRSLSRTRGRSISAASRYGAYESEKEQGCLTSPISRSSNEAKRTSDTISRTNSVRNRVSNPGQAKHAGVRTARNQAKEWSEDESACSLQISNLEDSISVGSLSEAEEKTIRTAFEELNVFRRNNANQAAATNVPDMPSNLVNPEAVELISDIRREYAIKLEESEERARELRADLAIEEQRGQELDRILKEMLSDRKTSDMQRSRRGRKTSNERKRMSNRLTEEAMAYFDECVSLSTFDSSDFSASEDPAYSLVGAAGPVGTSSLANGNPSTLCCYDQGNLVDHKQVQLKPCEDSKQTGNSSNTGPGSSQLYEFSFADRRVDDVRPEEDIRSYIKNFERETKKDIDSEASISYYDAEEYSIGGQLEEVLFDRVLYHSRIESGGLLLCGGAISCLPFASTM
ncbi:serine-rich adhesin for platelets-like isoform X2 [Salvia splendens]|uniref:serine-rich adhesin for platelets-like isoform X2 n=1 Tax=Salvia splendens TaxID=180675 RepID=UPI001C26230E|nr:serine-rich adhesin for platelets-like isoform X2 [Salvia splendens]